jgi:hypothetical protein
LVEQLARGCLVGALVGVAACGRIGFAREPDAAADAVAAASCATHGCTGQSCDQSDPLGSGLAGWWPFDDGVGLVARDASGHDRSGALLGGPVWIPGQVGGALQFDGDDDRVSIGSASVFDLRFPMTMAAWVRADVLISLARHSIVGRDEPVPVTVRSFEWGVAIDGDVSLTTYPGCVTEGQLYTYGQQIAIATWSHLALTLAGDGTATHYIDGVRVHTETIEPITCGMDATTYLGGTPYGPYQWHGALDEIRIYDRALDACEIEGLFCYGGWHCSNGRQDCGETAVDEGADCPSAARGATAAAH